MPNNPMRASIGYFGDTKGMVSVSPCGLRLSGSATAWDDLRVDALSTKVGGTAPTDEAGFRGDSDFLSRNFVHTQADEVQFALQMPHTWKMGTDIHPHIHFSPWGAGSASVNRVRFVLEWYDADITGQFQATTASLAMTASWVGNKQWYHLYCSEETDMTLSGSGLSHISKCRLYRDNTTASNLADKVSLLYLDFHYEIDSLGSNRELSKE